MATKLTPDMLRKLVLEEKAKMMNDKKTKQAKKDLALEMDEEWPGKPAHTVKQTPGKKLQTLKMLKEQEVELRDQLRKIQERRLALRRQIVNDLD
jgi:hypothetical protein